MPSRSWGFLALLVLTLPAFLPAKTITVDVNGAGDYATIQEAIDAAEDGDLVLVAEGEYEIREPITFRGKAISVVSEAGPDETVIRMSDGPADLHRASVVIFDKGETRDAILEGFTITGGLGTHDESMIRPKLGGGILCRGASPTIRYNVIRENEMSGIASGGGIATVEEADPLIVHNLICYNTIDRSGGGVCFYMASGVLLENTIMGNTAWGKGGGIRCAFSDTLIQGNTIVGNVAGTSGGAVYATDDPSGNLLIINNTMSGNVARESGGGLSAIAGLPVTVRNCIIRGNLQRDDQEIVVVGPGGPVEVSYCCLSPGSDCSGNGNTCADPLFLDPGSWEPCDRNPDAPCVDIGWDIGVGSRFASWRSGHYELLPESPCIDGGDPQDPPDADGTRADVGALYFDQSPLPLFRRGDVNGDGKLGLADPLTYLQTFLFQQDGKLPCPDAADADDDGQLGLTDAVYLLSFIFLPAEERPEIPAPYPDCGVDPTRDQNYEFAETGTCVYGGCGE